MFFQNSIGIDIQENNVSIGLIRGTVKGLEFKAFYDCRCDTPNDRFHGLDGYLAEFIARFGVEQYGIILGVPEEICLIRQIVLPFSAKEDIGSVIKYEIEKYVPLPASKIEYQYCVEEEDRAGGKIHIKLFVVKKEDIKPFLDLKDVIPEGISAIVPTGLAVSEYKDHLSSGRKPKIHRIDQPSAARPGSEDIRAAALAAQLFLKESSPVNFLPDRFRKKPSKLPIMFFWVLLLLMFICAGVAGVSFFIHNRIQVRQVNAMISDLRDRVSEVERIEKRIELLRIKNEDLDRVSAAVPQMTDILRELTRILPKDTYLQEFEFNKNIIRIKGSSANASRLIEPLESSLLFSEAGFESKISISKENKESFIIRMKFMNEGGK